MNTAFSRRNLLKSLGVIGTSSMLVHPKELMDLMPDEYRQTPNMGDDNVRLSSNENPYSPSPKMAKAIAELGPDLCRYPNMHFSTLEKMIAEREGVDPAQVVVTSGSREALNAVGLVNSLNGGNIAACMPTYKSLLSYAEHFGALLNISPLDENMGYNLPAIKASLNDETKLVFICNPNNPTGTLLDADELSNFCKEVSTKVPVFVDEVYKDYIEEKDYPSMKGLIDEGYNVIIARTFSKIYGLAGARVGYLMTNKDQATYLRKSLMSGTNILGLKMAMTALEDESFREFSLVKNKQAKQMIYEALDEIGLKYIPSHTNFVFFHTGQPIAQVAKTFADRGVEVGRAFPPFNDWCRISTGTLEEVEVFTTIAKDVFS
jgi:histidinol-phosphate aminotransferase